MSNPVSTIVSQIAARCAGLWAFVLGLGWLLHRIDAGFLPPHQTVAAHPEAFNAGYTAGYMLATVVGGIGSITLIVFGLLFLFVPGYSTALLVRIFSTSR